MKKTTKLMMAAAVALGLASVAVGTQSATVNASTGIAIDGQFADWDQISATKSTYWDDGTGSTTTLLKVAADTTTVNVYAEVHKGDANEAPKALWVLTVGGKTRQLQLADGSGTMASGSGEVYLNDRSAAVGSVNVVRKSASGVYTSDYSVVEFSVDLAKAGIDNVNLGDNVTLNVASAGLGNDNMVTTVGSIGTGDVTGDVTNTDTDTSTEAGTTGSSETTSTSSSSTSTSGSNVSEDGVVTDKGDADTTKGDQNNSNDDLNIVIDGAFQDWTNVAITKVAGDSVYNSRYMAMVSDGKYVYVYVKMQPYDAMPGYGDYNFQIGGKTYNVWSSNIPNNLTVDGDAQAVTLTGGDTNEGSQYGTVATGYVKRQTLVENGQSYGWYDTMEFKLDLSKLNVSTMNGQQITMSNPNVGNGAVTAAGGSTGPVLLASVGVLLAGVGYMKVKKIGMFAQKEAVRVSGK